MLDRLLRFPRLLLACAGLCPVLTSGAPGADTALFLVKSWRTPEGLPQNTVQAIAQTPDGYLWTGTKGGLSRFDGVRFTNYGLSDGLKSLNVRALAGDGEGGLWIGTVGGGLSRWHDGRITTLTTADGLLHDEIYSLAAAEPGGVWVGTGLGLQHLGQDGFTRVGGSEGLDGLVVALAAGDAKELWVSVEAVGLFRVHQGRCERAELPPAAKSPHPSSLLVDAVGKLWAGMGNGIVCCRHEGTWIDYSGSQGVPFSSVCCMARGAAGEIRAGSYGEGLHVFRDGRFHAVPGPDASVRAVRVTRDGVLWVGTHTGGLNRLTVPRVTAHPVGTASAQDEVLGLAEHPSGQFWAATWGGGLHRGPLDGLKPVTGVPLLARDPHLRAGLSTSSGSMCFIGPTLVGHWDAITREFGFSPMPGANLTSVCEGADGSILLGGRDGVLRRLAGGKVPPVTHGNFPSPIAAVLRGKRPGVWVATSGAGLFHWDSGKTERWTTAEGLPVDTLRALHEDAEGTLWIGTGGGGLAWLKDGRIHHVDSRQGLLNDSICPILEDDGGHLWLGSLHGISRVSKRELFEVAAGRAAAVHSLALDESDGMPSSECTSGYSPAGLRSRSGLLLFSTTRHIVAVDPRRFSDAPPPPVVRIESVAADGKLQPPPAAELSFPPGLREIGIEYTAFNYLKPDKIRFRHRLAGMEEEWTDTGARRVARFSLLPPGRYAFEVNAANEDGRWHPDVASLAFVVQPFFWQTGWFRAVGALLLVASGGGAVWRMAHIRFRWARERERLARAEAEALQHRNELAHLTRVTTLGELASALAHEINHPLGAILRNAEAAELFLQAPSPDLDEIRAILADIRSEDERAGAVIDRMRTLLQRHELEMRSLDLAVVIREVAALLRVDAHERGVKLEVEIQDGLPRVSGDRVHLQQVLLNLVLNGMDALLDTAGDQRIVRVGVRRTTAHLVEVAVSDRGSGIPAERLAHVFDPFFTTKPNGMGMGLAISRTIVEAHGGELRAENNSGGGATFRFTLHTAEEGAAA